MTQRLAFVLVALLLTACSDEPGQLASVLPKQKGLNVLIVSFDALRADALGIYGYGRGTSPHLDAFAKRSLVFDHAYTAAPVTPTSFAAAFTGQYPFRVFYKWTLIETLTIAEVFSRAGYRTVGLFNNPQIGTERNFQQGWDQFEVVYLPDEELLSLAVGQLRELRNERFFAWLHFLSPHAPYDWREESLHLYSSDYVGRFRQSSGVIFSIANDNDLKRLRELYDGEVYFADRLFAQLLEELEVGGLANNTIVVVTSDHGEEFLEHGGVQHNGQYEEHIRIPLLIKHPAMEIGARTNVPYLNTDLLPTLASVAGLVVPNVLDGLDLTRNIRSDRLRVSTGMTHARLRQVTVTQGADKLIVTCRPKFREELYDLGSDPREQDDRILDRPNLAERLYSAMTAAVMNEPCRAIQNAVRGVPPQETLNDKLIEKLRSLGYLH